MDQNNDVYAELEKSDSQVTLKDGSQLCDIELVSQGYRRTDWFGHG